MNPVRSLNLIFNRSECRGCARFACCRVILRGCVALVLGCGVARVLGCGVARLLDCCVALLPARPVDLRARGEDVVEYPGKVACPSGRRCSTRNAVWCHSHPGFKSQRYRHCRPAPMGPGGFVMPEWFPSNVARNSHACILGSDIRSLELQRLWPISKNDRVKLRATFGGVVTAVTFGHLYRPRAPLSGPALHRPRPFIGPAPLHLQGCRRGGTPKGPASAACV